MAQTPAMPAGCQWAIFLHNHDELTLEMVTPEEREFMYGHYAKDACMHALLMSLPGSPVMYYGDEIGMGDHVYQGDRNGVRTPMQWSADRNGGFSESENAALYFPVVNDAPYGFQMVNVDTQERSPSSLLSWVRAIVALCASYHSFGRGTFEPIAAENRRVLAFIRRHHDEIILCVNNLARHAQYAELDLGEFKGWSPMKLWSGQAFPVIGTRPYQLTMSGRDFFWFRLMPPGGPERLGAVASAGA